MESIAAHTKRIASLRVTSNSFVYRTRILSHNGKNRRPLLSTADGASFVNYSSYDADTLDVRLLG